ncbi:type I polyketide synthase [Parapedobacter indicus]|uniref:Acyl transferase domain-containing protein n=1 Tax=Parapedobacter indicus TaxID=1477437 RepID=A0A1I3HMN5_9SPHI|nr:type I polyketide synthase [Parapedobacter indicus]PPL03100.1 acyl transferase domain-containing protein [Parapedobacter indicus]SFI37005.1 Acyl transferase domain-containing protein [Parapedobacter indicus]
MDKKNVADLVLNFPDEFRQETALILLDSYGKEKKRLNFEELRATCLEAAQSLLAVGDAGDVVLLAVDDHESFIRCFFGCILAGRIPAPLPPLRGRNDKSGMGRLKTIAQQRKAHALLVPGEQCGFVDAFLNKESDLSLPIVAADRLSENQSSSCSLPDILPHHTAYIQYTSGSTSMPKGVVLRHENVIANLFQMYQVFQRSERVRVAGWIPLHHDMGLVGHLFTALYETGTAILLPPTSFIAKPDSWLRAIDTYKANSAAAPNFAFAHCVRKINPSGDLDLSSWKYAYVGSETVSPEILDGFAGHFSVTGFRKEAFKPVYGLAEATLLVAGGGDSLSTLDKLVQRRDTGNKLGRALIPYRVSDLTTITIRKEPGGKSCAEGEEGEIYIRGNGVSSGYYGDEAGMDGLATGDRGFLSGDFLYITGRSKEIVIIRGVNHSSEDIEHAARMGQPFVRSNDLTAAVSDTAANRERFYLFQEIDRHLGVVAYKQTVAHIRANLADNYAIVPDEIVLLPTGFLPRTANYKISRKACLRRYLAEELQPLYTQRADEEMRVGVSPDEADPIVITGAACRFPGGATSPEAFWELLAQGRDAITEVPASRWDNALFYDERPAIPGKTNTAWGGFVGDMDLFDPAFFGISEHEAPEIDPQHRLLLETSWRLMENSGTKKEELAGSSTGVFIGVSTNDYLYMKIKLIPGMESFNAYSGLGNANSIAANRLSYFYDLKGPSMAIDTACSSSLTAFHLAVQAMRNGECTQAIVGGVNALLSPGPTITLSQFGMMSATGRCKTFDASADGYVRSEGCGLVMLKRRSAALRDGDRILAVVRATKAAQDGHSAVITAPDAEAQHRLLRETIQQSGIAASAISYVEAHGTGTSVGDPVEMAQIRKVYGEAGGASCYVGSVKSNIGHLEAAAGIASVIKIVWMLQQKKIPPHIHLQRLNPHIQLNGSRLEIADALTEWKEEESPRMAAISSFGFGGSLVHAILEEYVEMPIECTADPEQKQYGQTIFPLSAHTPQALSALADCWTTWLADQPEASVQELAAAQALNRSTFRYRSYVLADTAADLRKKLLNSNGNTFSSLGQYKHICFLFTGQGEQYAEMGREMYHRYPAFRTAFNRCSNAFEQDSKAPSLYEIAFGKTGEGSLDEMYIQPVLFAVQYALAQLWESVGCIPDVVLGHSLGEYAAACIAGCFSPETAMLLLKKRAALASSLPIKGHMLAVTSSPDQIQEFIGNGSVCIAAINSSSRIVLAGRQEEITDLQDVLSANGITHSLLRTGQAFHSPLLDPIVDEFQRFAAELDFHVPQRKWISSVTGKRVDTRPDAAYWAAHLRQPVNFRLAADRLPEEAVAAFIQIGPGGSSLMAVNECGVATDALLLRSLNVKKGDRTEAFFFLDSVGKLYRGGIDIRWDALFPGNVFPGKIPGIVFQQQSYWLKELTPARLAHFADTGTPSVQTFASVPSSPAGQPIQFIPDWIPVGALPPTNLTETTDTNWLVVGATHPFNEALSDLLKAAGTSVFRIPAKATQTDYDRLIYKISHREKKENINQWKMIFSCAAVNAFLERADASALDSDIKDSITSLVLLLRALHKNAVHPQVWIVTQQAQHVGTAENGDALLRLAHSAIWGFAKTLFLEHPEWRGGLVDVEAVDHKSLAMSLLAKILNPQHEHCVAIRGNQQYVQQLTPIPASEAPVGLKKPFRSDGVTVITGGLGGLGLACAQWAFDNGSRHLLLISRKQLPPQEEWELLPAGCEHYDCIQRLIQLKNQGAQLRIVSLDVRDTAGLEAVFGELSERELPVRGIIHAAGVNWFSKVADLDTDVLLDTLRIKMHAAWALHRLSQQLDLDYFLLFSSVSALWGSVELSHYTAANHFMDMLAHQRNKLGVPALSINWGPWAEVGMSAAERETEVLSRMGFRLFPAKTALGEMEKAMNHRVSQAVITDIDWGKFSAFINFSLQPSLFANFAEKDTPLGSRNEDRLAKIKRSNAEDAHRLIGQAIRNELRSVMLIESTDEIDAHQRFNFMGLDSLMAISFVVNLEECFRLKLPSMLPYNYPTIRAVNDFIFEALFDYPYGDQVETLSASQSVVDDAVMHTKGDCLVTLKEATGLGAVTLYCFPAAGSGASVYSSWISALPNHIALVAIQAPGREERNSEQPHKTMAPLIAELLTSFDGNGRDFYFFGHSLGALVAYELFAALKKANQQLPTAIFFSGCGRPGGVNATFNAKTLLEEHGAALDESRKNTLHTDINLLETYRPSEEKITVPVVTIGGKNDVLAPPENIREWVHVTENDFSVSFLEGGHDLLRENREALIALIESQIPNRIPNLSAV